MNSNHDQKSLNSSFDRGEEDNLESFNLQSIMFNQGYIVAQIYFKKGDAKKDFLRFSIEIPYQPFEYDDLEQEGSLTLDGIQMPVKSYHELANQSYRFPINPEEGYIDGSIYINHMHNPINVTQLNFGQVHGNQIDVEIIGTFQFENDSDVKTIQTDSSVIFKHAHICYTDFFELSTSEQTGVLNELLNMKHFEDKVTGRKVLLRSD